MAGRWVISLRQSRANSAPVRLPPPSNVREQAQCYFQETHCLFVFCGFLVSQSYEALAQQGGFE